MNRKTVGRLVRVARLRSGLTQSEVARRSGLSPEYLSRLEAGKFSPTIETLQRIGAALGVSIFTILRKS
jgi:transcriptional regulator with XRE-family HTH domain